MIAVARRATSVPAATPLRRLGASIGVLVAVLTLLAAAAPPATASDGDDDARTLVERHAPIFFVKEQSAPCDQDGEPFEPAPVEIVLDNPEVFLRQVGNGDPVAMAGPSGADLFDLREGWYIDFPGDALRPGCIFEEDARRFHDGRSVVYAHIATESDRPGFLAVQYWTFWYHNSGKNDHEGDWEFVQVLFEADTVAEALESMPAAVGYAQHEGGERAAWDDAKLDREGSRPVVFSARGSHASYFGSALFLGRSGREGFGCDDTDGPSRRLDPDVVLLPDVVTDPDDPFAWLAFQGRWGQREAGFFNGPTGPFEKSRWVEPVTWQDDLRSSSVVIPTGDRHGDTVVRTFCTAVERGSTALVVLLRTPLAVVALLATAVLVVAAAAGRTRWTPVTTSPLRADRALGQIVRAAVRAWRDQPLSMIGVGLIYVPVALLTMAVQAGVQSVPLVDDVLELAGERSGVGVVLALAVGGTADLLAFVYVSAVVARLLGPSSGEGRTVWPWRLVGLGDLGRLVGAVARATVVVVLLLVSVVGIPWGIRQLVRYQLAPQVVVLEGSGSAGALARSSDLVRGRWWWTAGVVLTVQAAVAAAGLVASMVVLLAATSIPLWWFNVLSSLIHVVLVPVGAAAMAYVYGSLATRSRGDADRSPSGAGRSPGPITASRAPM